MNKTLIAILGLALPSLVMAAPIIWETPVNISGDADVSTKGEYVYAWNMGHRNNTIVNGVEFRGFFWRTQPEYGEGFTLENVTVGVREGNEQIRFSPVYDPKSGPFSQLSQEYRVLLGSIIYVAPAGYLEVTLGGLTTGATYQVQFWISDARTDVGATRNATVCIDGGGMISEDVSLKVDGVANPENIGQFIIGTFTADADTQVFLFMGQKLDGKSQPFCSYVNGISLRRINP